MLDPLPTLTYIKINPKWNILGEDQWEETITNPEENITEWMLK